jgi:hypothetical protein
MFIWVTDRACAGIDSARLSDDLLQEINILTVKRVKRVNLKNFIVTAFVDVI